MRHLLSFCRTLVECRHRGALFLETAFVCTRCGAHRFDTSEPWILPDAVRLLAAELRPRSDPQLASLQRHILEVVGDLLIHADARVLRKALRSLTRAAATARAGPLDAESRPAP
jgi:hypothetical protein